ncbi:short-chain dehydrogenase [Metarhizium robertsii ARSEF 23]|uniref:Short-chain dehydrogenase n=1 Tax=Metarhizium robertsii (strain ARSEF 23 / ATCC MYA-3075) TaxID=655844 RepID=E9ETW2_METRA|nr:short-chain dehydrogenase [Metarhizium robertsii ARSEF 23]EFZ00865.1 short-chain dehydrogenase [Metarhizium robertsii ARSEF 23]
MSQSLKSLWPPKPPLTEANLPDQTGKVFLVTGASGGVGEQLASILYQHNAKVYLAARSEDKTAAAISSLRQQHPQSKGDLVFLPLDLADLGTIAQSAERFLRLESRLDVLWLNAGVMVPPAGSKTAQGYELQLGTNNIGHFLLTKLLHPVLKKSAAAAPKNSVRVVWVSSSAIDLAPSGVIDFQNMAYDRDENAWVKYGRSKAGNVLHAVEFARRTEGEGIVSVNFMAYPAKFGAYTELFAGLHPDVTVEKSGMFIAPWGRLVNARKDLFDPELGKRYWEWTEEQVKPYV